VEDLKSTNGTFVNDRHVNRHTLENGDVVLVGKHKLVFERASVEEPAEPTTPRPAIKNLKDTVYLDTKKHRELLATLRTARSDADKTAPRPAAKIPGGPAAAAKVGILRVVAGRAEQSEYILEAQTSLIGRSDIALVRLRGWFKPKVAVAIARNGAGYVVTPLGGKTLVNNQPLRERHGLKDGDILEVSGLTLEFRWRDNGLAAPEIPANDVKQNVLSRA